LSSKVSGSSNKNVYEAVQGMENNGRSFLWTKFVWID
jgi:hypothetical protein